MCHTEEDSFNEVFGGQGKKLINVLVLKEIYETFITYVVCSVICGIHSLRTYEANAIEETC